MKRTTLTTKYRFGDKGAEVDCGKCSLTEYMEAVARSIAALVYSVEAIGDSLGSDGHGLAQQCIERAGEVLKDTDWYEACDATIQTRTKETP